jgi:hypothetical protein
MNANERFEIIGEMYYRRFHRLRPGKDESAASGRSSMDNENVEQFQQWRLSDQFIEDCIETIWRRDKRIDKLTTKLDGE